MRQRAKSPSRCLCFRYQIPAIERALRLSRIDARQWTPSCACAPIAPDMRHRHNKNVLRKSRGEFIHDRAEGAAHRRAERVSGCHR